MISVDPIILGALCSLFILVIAFLIRVEHRLTRLETNTENIMAGCKSCQQH